MRAESETILVYVKLQIIQQLLVLVHFYLDVETSLL